MQAGPLNSVPAHPLPFYMWGDARERDVKRREKIHARRKTRSARDQPLRFA